MLKVNEARVAAWKEIQEYAEEKINIIVDIPGIPENNKKKLIRSYQEVIKVAQKKAQQYAN